MQRIVILIGLLAIMAAGCMQWKTTFNVDRTSALKDCTELTTHCLLLADAVSRETDLQLIADAENQRLVCFKRWQHTCEGVLRVFVKENK